MGTEVRVVEYSMKDHKVFDLEESVNLLQRNSTCLGNEEEGEDEGEEGQSRKEHIDTVSHCSKHLLGESRYEEVEQPVAGGRAGLGKGSETGIEEFLDTN